MRKWICVFFSRLGDLIIKNLSMKVESAAIVTGVYLASPEKGAYQFTLIVVIWLAVVGLRYAEKVKGLLPKFKGA